MGTSSEDNSRTACFAPVTRVVQRECALSTGQIKEQVVDVCLACLPGGFQVPGGSVCKLEAAL